VSPTDKTPVSFVITKGESGQEIANALFAKQLIRQPLVFRLYIRFLAQNAVLSPGEYKLSKALSVFDMLSVFSKGPQEVWITIPEGLRREQVALRFINGLSLSSEETKTFSSAFLSASQGEEGYLFPDTYLVPLDITGTQAVALLKRTFDQRFGTTFREHDGYTLQQTVILASLLERETRTAAERPIVAGILKNRLRIGMPLQIDATVQYALASVECRATPLTCTNWWPTVLRADYQFESSYNTYKISGLPPAPISNPGLASLTAVSQSEDSEYFYYIHDTKGQPHYARTLEEHNLNVSTYLR
jgi:UPF0755 protein